MRYFEVASRLIEQQPNKAVPGYGLGQRHVQISLQFFMAAIFVAMNMALPIAIIPLTHPQYPTDIGITSFPNWTGQSLILVSTQAGYAVTQLFGNCVSDYYGYHFVMPFSMFLSSIFCFILPVMTEIFGIEGLIICLLLQGASQGFSLPVIPDYLNKWTPRSERNCIGTLMFAANILGAVFSTKITAFVSTSFLGWTITYYLLGSLGFVWTYIMINFGENAPETTNNISSEELDHIVHGKRIENKVPWKKLLECPSILAIWAAHAGTFWAIWLVTAEMPSYLYGVLNFKIDKDGDVVGDAYFMSWLFSFIMSGSTSYLIRSRILSLNSTRKIAQSISSCLTAGSLIILSFLSDPRWVIFFINCIFCGLTVSFWGFMLKYNDIVRDNRIVTHVGNLIGTMSTFMPAIFKQLIVTDQTDGFQWSIMFWLTAAVLILSNLAFFFYSSSEIDISEFENDGNSKNDSDESKYLMESPTSNSKVYSEIDPKVTVNTLNEVKEQHEPQNGSEPLQSATQSDSE